MAYMRRMARNAIANPSEAPDFRIFDLNQRLRPGKQMIVEHSAWLSCAVAAQPDRSGPCYLGIDLGGSTSMGAFAAYWPQQGRLDVRCGYPNTPPLLQRGRADGVGRIYERTHEEGDLVLYPGLTLPVDAFISDCIDWLGDAEVVGMGADRYRRAEMVQALQAAKVAWPIVWRGTGTGWSKADGAMDVRAFQRAVLEGRLRPGPNLALEHSVAESELRFDVGGNPALEKARKRARIDALQAAVIATGIADLDKQRWEPQEEAGASVMKIE